MFGTWGRRVASILIALLVATTTVTVSVKALREKVIEFFTEVFDTHTVVTFVDDPENVTKNVVFEKRAPSYIPAGYELETEEYLNTSYRVTYIDGNGNRIVYRQRKQDNQIMTIDTENTHNCEVIIGSCRGMIYANKGTTFIVFGDADYVYTLSGVLSVETLIKISESIEI